MTENSPQSVKIFDKMIGIIDQEKQRIKDLGFNDLVVTQNIAIESLDNIDMVVTFSYDNDRKKRAMNGRSDNSNVIDVTPHSSYYYGFPIYREHWINTSEATKQAIDNLDAFNNVINTALNNAQAINKIDILEKENLRLKSKVEDLESKLAEIFSSIDEDNA